MSQQPISQTTVAVQNFHTLSDEMNVRVKVAARICSVCEATLWRWAKERADFPKPRRIGPRTTVWRVGELRAFIASV